MKVSSHMKTVLIEQNSKKAGHKRLLRIAGKTGYIQNQRFTFGFLIAPDRLRGDYKHL
jgi:hypothetical protein